MPRRNTIVTALVLITGGTTLRFHYYYFLGQYLMIVLIAVSIVILACSVLQSLIKTGPDTYKDSLALAVTVAILFGLACESDASNKAKNEKYVERLSAIVDRYIEENQAAPDSFGEALEASGEMLPNRGDADGNSLVYVRLGDRIYVLRTVGRNQKDDRDDVQVIYLNGNYVSFEDLSKWIESEGTPEEKWRLEQLGPWLR